MPTSTMLEQYRVSDFLEWHETKQLLLNPHFQRRSVWTPQAKVYLIDTILRQLPIPKIYMRTNVDPSTRRSYREIVDGQQRLRAITEFANDRFTLTRRADEYAGMTYSALPSETQESFLTYAIAVDQLINANDSDVLEVFARLNSYTATLKPAEKRHAKYQGNFKWAVHEHARRWSILWEHYGIVTMRERLRMGDDALMAEMFGIFLEGVHDGGAKEIERLYKNYDQADFSEVETESSIDKTLTFILEEFGYTIDDTAILRSTQFLMLFAAVAHALIGIPPGKLGDDMPHRNDSLADIRQARTNLTRLASVLDADEPPPQYQRFWNASQGTTQRIATRRVRFLTYFQALLPESC